MSKQGAGKAVRLMKQDKDAGLQHAWQDRGILCPRGKLWLLFPLLAASVLCLAQNPFSRRHFQAPECTLEGALGPCLATAIGPGLGTARERQCRDCGRSN